MQLLIFLALVVLFGFKVVVIAIGAVFVLRLLLLGILSFIETWN